MLECFEVFAFFEVLGADVADEGADPVDVVSEAHDGNDFNKDETDSFLVVAGMKVSEANSEHDVDSPVVGPDVLFVPLAVGDVDLAMPVLLRVEVGHGRQKDGEGVGEAEIEQDNFDKGPVLFVVVILYEQHFQFFYFV